MGKKVSKSNETALTLPDPTGDYERWANRADKNEKPLDFLQRVWGKYIDAGVMYAIDLKGQQKTTTNLNPKKALDKTLADAVWRQCKEEGKDLSEYLPNQIVKTDRIIASLNLPIAPTFASALSAAAARSRKR